MQQKPAYSFLGFTILGYWAMFWLLNGMDKYLCRTDLGFITWFGNHRNEKFTMYFDRLGMSEAWVSPTLIFAGVWELAITGLCIAAMLAIHNQMNLAARMRRFHWAIGGTIITFMGFCLFDVVVGDRAELLEHSTYIGVAIISYILLALEPVFQEMYRDLQNTTPES